MQVAEIPVAAEVGAADDPHAVIARGDADHAGRESALESGANDRPVPATDDVEIAAAHLQVGRGDVEEVVRPRVDKLKLPKAILDWRGVQHLWLLAQIEPRQRIGGVLIRRIDSVLIRARDVTNAAELVHRTMARDVVADRDARARAEDALGIEQRHSVLIGLGAEPQTEVVVRCRASRCGRRDGDQRREAEGDAGRQTTKSQSEPVHECRFLWGI